ncbi:MAG: hypothetical protein LBV68_07520, partial [Spirochaetaceae bacterium]|nr:hypothetical protein [Spirochaetaceae bacterium]
ESVQGENSSVIPVAAIAEAERTAVAIPVIGETTQGQSASIQREEIKAVTGKPANEAVTEMADKNKTLPPKEIASKIDAMPPEAEISTSGAEMPETPSGKIEPEPLKVESAKNADFMPELSRESLKTTAGISTEKAALDVKSVSGAGNTSSVQRASPSSAGNEALITKGTLLPPKDTISKNVERVLVTSPENEKQQVNHIKEAEKNEAVNPHDTHDTEATNTIRESVTNNGKENVQKTLAALTQPERKPGTLSIGILLEGNMATRQGWGAEAGFIAGYEINQDLAFGIKGGYGNDFRGIDYFEGLLYGRYYLPFKKEEFGIFAQVGIGGISFTEERKKKDAAVSTVMLDLSIGARFPFGSFYIEPYIRAGYPVFIGAGAVFGWRF